MLNVAFQNLSALWDKISSLIKKRENANKKRITTS
jgi:hypothetical protein